MIRSCSLAITFVLVAGWMTAYAQQGGDPDAKGTVTAKVTKIDKGRVTVEVTRTASANWEVGGVSVFLVPKDGGYIYQMKPIAFPAYEPPNPPPATGTVTNTIPNGDYTLWALHDVSTVELPPFTMTVGSPLVSLTVADSTATPATAQGTIAFAAGSPTRQQEGTVLVGSGPYTVSNDYRLIAGKSLYLGAIPVAGGKYREGTATGASGNWSANVGVRSDLKYNAIAIMGVEPKPTVTGLPQSIGSAWAKDK